MSGHPLRVCYFGTYRATYSRNEIMIEALRRNGVEVLPCHEPLWQGIDDRVQVASGGWLKPGFAARVVRTYARLLKKHAAIGDYDLMVLGYPGQFDVFLARLLAWRRRKPLVLDVFMSLYLIALERGLTARHPFTGRLIYWLETIALRLPDRLILDTAEYVAWFGATYGSDPARFRLVPTGADDRVFRPIQIERPGDGLFRVLYYGTFTPNHGVDTIVQAALILREWPDIYFELVGEGPMKAQALNVVRDNALPNVTFSGWVDKGELLRKAAAADLCLGAFGTTPQSQMTIQNKIYEGLAMGRCVLTGDSPTMRRSLVHGEHLWLCERASPEALAQAILTLSQDPALCADLARQGHERILADFTPTALGRQYRHHLEELI